MSRIEALLIGQPKTITDAKGEWRSAIFRESVVGPVALELRGLEGDQVGDTKHHGSPDQAVCCQPLSHYSHWNTLFGANLMPGAVGENWTLSDVDETSVCIGDIYGVGTARVQVSAPRYPCSKQERKTAIPGFLKAIRAEKKTGWYLRVLTTGTVQAGDALVLEARPQPNTTLAELNQAVLGEEWERALIEKHLALPELSKGWKNILRHRMAAKAKA